MNFWNEEHVVTYSYLVQIQDNYPPALSDWQNAALQVELVQDALEEKLDPPAINPLAWAPVQVDSGCED